MKKDEKKEENIKEEPQIKENEEIENKPEEQTEQENKKDDENKEVNNKEFKVAETFVEKPQKTFIAVIIIILFLAILILSTGFAIINIGNRNIISGITIRGIDVSGLREAQANQKLSDILNSEIEKEINFIIGGEKYSIVPKQFEASFDIDSATETAYMVGKDSNIFVNNYNILMTLLKKKEIELDFTYNEKLLNNLLNSINAKLPNAVMDYMYSVEGTELIITNGKPGNAINIEKTKEILLENIKSGNYEDIKVDVEYRNPKEIDIQKIYDEVYAEPKNAYFIKEPFELFTHKNGIDFDINEAKELLKEDKEEYVIKLEVIKPEVLTSDLGTEAFTDLLGTFSTKYDELNKPRTTNLRLATEKINGVIVMPGETFSYNKTLGKRTSAAGYKEAAGYASGKVVQMIGGGICQISSTLYDAVVYANLEIVERHNHMFVTSYAKAGRDATVSYGSLDFKFKNNRNYPILIKATAKGGISEVEIYGIKEKVEYDVEIETKILNYIPFKVIYEDDDTLEVGKEKVEQYGQNGCNSVAYKIVKLNGVEQSREVLSTDRYSAMNKIIKRGTKVVTPVEETVETNTNPVEPTPETVPVEPTTTAEDTNNIPNTETPIAEPTTPVTQEQEPINAEQEEQPEITTSVNPGGTVEGE